MNRGTLGALLALLAVTPGLAQEKKGEDPEGVRIKLGERDPAFTARVNDAVEKGRKWLLGKQEADGRFWEPIAVKAGHGPYPHGPTALALLTLLHSGSTPFDPPVEKGFKVLREMWDAWKASGGELYTERAWKTYEVGLTLMALEARARWKPPALRGRAHDTALAAGGMKITPPDAEWAKQLKDFIVDTVSVGRQRVAVGKTGTNMPQEVKDAWSYPQPGKQHSDHSNTQYAILGLKSASRLAPAAKRADLRPPMDLWLAVFGNMIETQENVGPRVQRVEVNERARREGYISTTTSSVKDQARGWGYNGGQPPEASSLDPYRCSTGSMTCVGIASVELAWSEFVDAGERGGFGWSNESRAQAQGMLKNRKSDYERSIHDGFAWMSENFSVEKNPCHHSWYFYYMYGLERAGVLSDRVHIGRHDWYREGAEALMSLQAGDGSWGGEGEGQTCATCFALLFLTRATVPVKAVGTH